MNKIHKSIITILILLFTISISVISLWGQEENQTAEESSNQETEDEKAEAKKEAESENITNTTNNKTEQSNTETEKQSAETEKTDNQKTDDQIQKEQDTQKLKLKDIDLSKEDESKKKKKLTKDVLDIDPEPQNKIIRKIKIVTYDPFSTDNFISNAGNFLHTETKPSAVDYDLLFEEGEKYDQEKIDETVRTMIEYPEFYLVEIYPIRTDAKGKVDILVLISDVWSFGFGLKNVEISKDIFNFGIVLNEKNFLGYRKGIELEFLKTIYQYKLMAGYQDDRLFGSPLRFEGVSGLIADASFSPNGYLFEFLIGIPLRSKYDTYGFTIQSQFEQNVFIEYEGKKKKTNRFR